jgi:diaminopimelate epimerase
MKFWKMQGLGNDYIVIDNRNGQYDDQKISQIARELCSRRFAIGADGVLYVYNSSNADIRMRMFNPDGSEAEMCGNGIRCFVKYCYEDNIIKKTRIDVETIAGIKPTWINVRNGLVESVKVDMGVPVFDRSQIPMIGEGTFIDQELKVNEEKINATALSIGNPHCVVFVQDVNDYPVRVYGPIIENHEWFPNRINVEFVQRISRNELHVRTWERGAGETLACGTGACASVVAANELGMTDGKVTVHLRGGNLEIEHDKRILMSGPAEKVFEGRIDSF